MTDNVLPWPAHPPQPGTTNYGVLAVVDEAPASELWPLALLMLNRVADLEEAEEPRLVHSRRQLLEIATAALIRLLDEQDAETEDREPQGDKEPDVDVEPVCNRRVWIGPGKLYDWTRGEIKSR